MKKFLIIFGIVLILLLGAIWTYVFLYGVPKSVDEVFARFSDLTGEPTYVEETPDTTVDIGDGSNDTPDDIGQFLYQVTTRPVAGAAFIEGGIRYVERGTGHIYEIDIKGGNERIISASTQARTIRALFSPTGDHVTLTRETETGLETVLGTLTKQGGEGDLGIVNLPKGAREVAFNETGDTLNFFVPSAAGGTGYAYTLATQKTTELFSIPLAQVRVLWGTPTYILTTPSGALTGYLYRLGSLGLEYVTAGKPGLMAFRHASGTVVSYESKEGQRTSDLSGGEVPLLSLFSEKCTLAGRGSRYLFCGSPSGIDESRLYPDDWYKGLVSFTDMLLRVDGINASTKLLSKLEEDAGRPIDIAAIGASADGSLIHFVNKYDGALWVFDVVQAQ